MDITGIDPIVAQLTARLAEATARNAAGAIYTQIKRVKAKHDDQATINELEEIVRDLISERSEALQIAQAYEEQLVAQRMSDQDIEYVVDTVIPTVRNFLTQISMDQDDDAAAKTEGAIDALMPLLSTDTLTVLQLLGFSYTKAIGEPLTFLVQRIITSRVPDPQADREITRLNALAQIELLKIAQDEEASARLKRVVATWRGTD